MRVRKAVFPAAGWGTRFLPATKAQPKEMLPLVDKPVIQYAVEEAVAAGIEQVIIVTSSQKRAIEDHFDHSFELESLLEARGDIEMLRRVRRIGDMAQMSYVRQKEQLGLGHAVLMAKELVGHEPFAVILSDDVVTGHRSCIGQFVDAYHRTGGSTLAVMQVPHDETSRYGVVDVDPTWDGDDPRLPRIRGVVEKPAPDDAPSDLAIIGRYVLTPKIFAKLEQTPAGAGGEIQLTDAIEALMQEQEVFAYAFEGTRHDAGTTMGWLKASLELALDREEFAPSSAPTWQGSTCGDTRRSHRSWGVRRQAAWLSSAVSWLAAIGWTRSWARGAWPPSSVPRTASSAARWPSRCCARSSAVTPSSWSDSATRPRPPPR